MCDYYGFIKETVNFKGRILIIVHPKECKSNAPWAFKTEYFNEFPDVQNKLLENGYYLVNVQNKTRWCVEEDTDMRAEVAKYMHEKYHTKKKCVIIGMSCGGMQGIYFASKYPELVSCMYLDAPVVNFLSCPFALGKAQNYDMIDEFIEHRQLSICDLISYRNHPLDHIDKLINYNIPIVLVCGDSDSTVPYEENGKLINDKYIENNAVIKTIIKKNADHHPHGLVDNTPIIQFINKYNG